MSDVKVVKVNEAVDVGGIVYTVDECHLRREKYRNELKISGYANITLERIPGCSYVDIIFGADEDEIALSKREVNALITMLQEARDHE